MITRAGDIYCEQGESFTLGFKIVNPDGSPFVLSDALDDAEHTSYLLLTVASAANITGDDRYLGNFWNPTDKYKKFYSTQAVELDYSTWPDANIVWTAVKALIAAEKQKGTDIPSTVGPVNYAIYYIVNSDGTRSYKQLIGTEDNASLEDYEFQFYQHITKEISNEWSQSGYDYALKVVSGPINSEEDGRPINIEFSYPLIGAHKLYVDTNVQGSIDDVEVIK